MNSAWGDVIDTKAFGTDEFVDFMQQIGSTRYVSIIVGSGTPQEAGERLEYMTAAAPKALAKECAVISSRALQSRIPRHRQRKLGPRRGDVTRLLREPTLKLTLFMDEFLRKQEAMMDKYDPEKKVTLTCG